MLCSGKLVMSTESKKQLEVDFEVEAALAFDDEDANVTIVTLHGDTTSRACPAAGNPSSTGSFDALDRTRQSAKPSFEMASWSRGNLARSIPLPLYVFCATSGRRFSCVCIRCYIGISFLNRRFCLFLPVTRRGTLVSGHHSNAGCAIRAPA
jgi:hypothetical protein